MFRKGFTLVEILIAMALVGILVAVVTPNLTKVMPDKKKALFVKAYSRTEIAVANMVNDPEMYPAKFDITESGNGYETFGLTNDEKPSDKTMLAVTGNAHGGDNKFCIYFAQEIGGACDNGKIQTNDGITYIITRKEKDKTDKDAVAAEIEINIADSKVGVIKVLNDGGVSCLVTDENSTDDKCQAYMNDRYNFKQKR